MLNKTQQRLELSEKSLIPLQKVNFNHVFTEVKRDKEFQAISKLFKELSSGKTSVPPTQPTTKSSFAGN
jgi:hypothetical protein